LKETRKGGRSEGKNEGIKPLKAELNHICHLLALLEANNILHVNRIGVKETRGDGRNERKKKERIKKKKDGTGKGIRQ
jgi:hypothetical protein